VNSAGAREIDEVMQQSVDAAAGELEEGTPHAPLSLATRRVSMQHRMQLLQKQRNYTVALPLATNPA
jgi:hypothetical protein